MNAILNLDIVSLVLKAAFIQKDKNILMKEEKNLKSCFKSSLKSLKQKTGKNVDFKLD